ncbi:unnamed protein product, partial [Candidula unifasciata]
KHNVHGVMRELLAKIIANRPENPIKFIADYFETLTLDDHQPTDLISKAVQVLTLTHHSRPMFDTNVQTAFQLLNKYTINKKLQGMNGTVLSHILHALCKNIPPVISIRLFKRLECFEYEAVTYDVFRSSVFTCCVLQDYITIADNLFQTLDVQKSGKADKHLCDVALEQLRNALASSRTDIKRIVESSYSLSPDGLFTALDKAMSRRHSQGFYSQDQFVAEACDSFLAK